MTAAGKPWVGIALMPEKQFLDLLEPAFRDVFDEAALVHHEQMIVYLEALHLRSEPVLKLIQKRAAQIEQLAVRGVVMCPLCCVCVFARALKTG